MFTSGDVWVEQRRFTLRQLRDLGFGKTSIEDQMMDEIGKLIAELENSASSNPNRIVDIGDALKASVINVLWAIIAGIQFAYICLKELPRAF